MILIDANILLYAYDADSQHHPSAARWLEALLRSEERIVIPWITIWAFIRVCTSARIWLSPLTPAQAFSVVRGWISQPGVVVLQPGPRHLDVLERLVIQTGAVGPKVTDAVLAALAIENGATLASADHDFRRFAELKWVNPLA